MITAKYESRIKPEGDYECIISKAHIDVAKSGKEYISIPMTVREDIEQPYKKGKIFTRCGNGGSRRRWTWRSRGTASIS